MSEPDVLEEWASLRGALSAHLEWLVETGVEALRPCDEGTLEERRARYRAIAREEPSLGSPLAPAGEAPRLSLPIAPDVPPYPSSAEPAGVAPSRPAEPAHAPVQQRADAHVASAPPARPPLATGAPALVTTPSATDLEALAREVAGCQRCALHRTRTQTVFARGSGSSGICFVGEGPGADEDAQGFPFVGAAGQLLDKMIAAMGLARDEVYVCNVVKCRPPKNRKPERDEMQACSGFLQRQLELVSPRVIVALGGTAVEGLLGLTGIIRLRGQWRLYRGEIPVMPTFHPAYLLRQPEAKREVWNDLKQVLEHLGRPIRSR